MSGGSRKSCLIATNAVLGYALVTLGCVLLLSGIFMVCVTAASKADSNSTRSLSIAGPCLVAGGAALAIVGVLHRFAFTRWRQQRRREEEAARLQRLVTAVIAPHRKDADTKSGSRGYTLYDNDGLVIGLNGLPHTASTQWSERQASRYTSTDRTANVPDAYFPGLCVDSSVDMEELKHVF